MLVYNLTLNDLCAMPADDEYGYLERRWNAPGHVPCRPENLGDFAVSMPLDRCPPARGPGQGRACADGVELMVLMMGRVTCRLILPETYQDNLTSTCS